MKAFILISTLLSMLTLAAYPLGGLNGYLHPRNSPNLSPTVLMQLYWDNEDVSLCSGAFVDKKVVKVSKGKTHENKIYYKIFTAAHCLNKVSTKPSVIAINLIDNAKQTICNLQNNLECEPNLWFSGLLLVKPGNKGNTYGTLATIQDEEVGLYSIMRGYINNKSFEKNDDIAKIIIYGNSKYPISSQILCDTEDYTCYYPFLVPFKMAKSKFHEAVQNGSLANAITVGMSPNVVKEPDIDTYIKKNTDVQSERVSELKGAVHLSHDFTPNEYGFDIRERGTVTYPEFASDKPSQLISCNGDSGSVTFLRAGYYVFPWLIITAFAKDSPKDLIPNKDGSNSVCGIYTIAQFVYSGVGKLQEQYYTYLSDW